MAKVTIKEIADILGVSTATVSRVLNNSGGYSEETKRRVLDVMKQYNYQANAMAKGLRTKKTNSVGVVLPDLTNEYFAKIAVAIERVLMKKGYSINIYNMSEDANKEELMLRDLESRGVDGLIYVSGYRNQVNRVKELNIPVVCVNQLEKMDETMPVIESGHEYGGYLAAKALLERGTERIIMVRDERDILPINQREQGFKAGLKDQHLRPLHISRIPFNVDAAQKEIADLIKNGKSFDGIFASSDILAIGALKALQQKPLQVPAHIQVIGFDNVTFSQYSYPALTTIHQSTDQLGEKAAERLIQLMEENQLDTNERIVIPVHLVERETTQAWRV